MFTGIINHLGKIVEKKGGKLSIASDKYLLKSLQEGTSIAVNGICLTVTKHSSRDFSIDFIPETEKKTNIGSLSKNDLVNLELPATPGTFLAGHIVQGHVDDVGKVKEIIKKGNSRIFTFEINKKLSKYVVPKGSIAVNGISLTVIDVDKNNFSVGIIPYTLKNTMFHSIKTGDLVNIEVDVLAKYIEKLIKK